MSAESRPDRRSATASGNRLHWRQRWERVLARRHACRNLDEILGIRGYPDVADVYGLRGEPRGR